jgi:integrase
MLSKGKTSLKMTSKTKAVSTTSPDQLRMARVAAVANLRTAQDTFNDYRDRKAANTLARQDADMDAFAVFLGRFQIQRTAEELCASPEAWRGVTYGIVQGFIKQQLSLGFAMRSVNGRLSTIRTYCELATKAGVIPPDELTMIKTVKGYSRLEGRRMDDKRETTRVSNKKSEGNILPDADIDRLLDHGDDHVTLRDAAMVVIMVDHGLRVGELVGLVTNGLDLARGTLTFYREKVDKTQTHQLTPRAAEILRAYMSILPQPIPGKLIRRSLRNQRLGSAGITRFGVFRILQEHGRARGIDNLSPHDLRHTWATNAAKSGTPIDRLTDAGGWSSSATPLNNYIKPARIANQGVLLEN